MVQIRSQARSDRFRPSIKGNSDYAARAACQISGILAVRPPSLPILNCPFLIFSANSMPPIATAAVRKLFKPSIAQPLLDSPMVLFDDVVQILAAPNEHSLWQFARFL